MVPPCSVLLPVSTQIACLKAFRQEISRHKSTDPYSVAGFFYSTVILSVPLLRRCSIISSHRQMSAPEAQ